MSCRSGHPFLRVLKGSVTKWFTNSPVCFTTDENEVSIISGLALSNVRVLLHQTAILSTPISSTLQATVFFLLLKQWDWTLLKRPTLNRADVESDRRVSRTINFHTDSVFTQTLHISTRTTFWTFTVNGHCPLCHHRETPHCENGLCSHSAGLFQAVLRQSETPRSSSPPSENWESQGSALSLSTSYHKNHTDRAFISSHWLLT